MQLNDSKKKNSLWVIRKILVRMFPWGGGPHAPSKTKTVQFATFSDLTWKGIFLISVRLLLHPSVIFSVRWNYLMWISRHLLPSGNFTSFWSFTFSDTYFQYTENWFIKRKVQVKPSFVWIMNLTGLADLITLKWKYWKRQGHPTRI